MRHLVFGLLLLCCLLPNLSRSQSEEAKTVLGPSNPDLYDGAIALMAGDVEEGIRLTLSGLNVETSRRERLAAYSNLCAGYILVDELDRALGYCDEALAISDSHWRSLTNRALIMLKRERFDAAERDIERAYQINPNAREVKTVRSMLLDEIDPVSPKITIDDRRQPADR